MESRLSSDQRTWEILKSRPDPALCVCGHQQTNHHYIRLVGDNTGRCLHKRCDCTIFDEE